MICSAVSSSVPCWLSTSLLVVVQLPWPAVRADLGLNLQQEEEYNGSCSTSEMATVSQTWCSKVRAYISF